MSLASAVVGDALNSSWRINVSGQVYGPYSGQQIKAFATEGRLAPHSIVQAGDGPWIAAIDDPVLGQLFVQKQAQKPAAPAPAQGFGARAAAEPAAGASAEPTSANFVVIADLRSRGSGPFEAAISRLGEVYRLNPLVWLLHTDRTAGTIRNELIQHMGNNDHLVIVDATRGKTAWFNLGPEGDSKIRKVWKRTDKSSS
jgi:hypothetical protein